MVTAAPARSQSGGTPSPYVFPIASYTDPIQLHWGAVKGGSDLFAPRGTPVVNMRAGTVTYAGYNAVGGYSVAVEADDGLTYWYAHFAAPPDVQAGARVGAGTRIGVVGNTGDAANTPPHLHIGIGTTIIHGADKYGGTGGQTGGSYDAVGLLEDVRAGRVPVVRRPQEETPGPLQGESPPPASAPTGRASGAHDTAEEETPAVTLAPPADTGGDTDVPDLLAGGGRVRRLAGGGRQSIIDLVYTRARDYALARKASPAEADAFGRSNVAIVWSESSFDPSIQNQGGAQAWGLYQNLIPGGRGAGYTPQQLQDPETNIRISLPAMWGAWTEHRLGQVYATNPEQAVVGLSRWGQKPAEEEIQKQVRSGKFREGLAFAPSGAAPVAAGAKAAAPASAPARGYAFPVVGFTGEIATHWGSEHGASDLMAPEGTRVVAMQGGTVVSVGSAANGNPGGNNLTIRGADGLDYYYAHLRDGALVKPGQQVSAGTPLGYVGKTGNAANTPPHLHLGIGKGIQSGVGPTGGSGVGYDAVGLLTRVLAATGGGTAVAGSGTPAKPKPVPTAVTSTAGTIPRQDTTSRGPQDVAATTGTPVATPKVTPTVTVGGGAAGGDGKYSLQGMAEGLIGELNTKIADVETDIKRQQQIIATSDPNTPAGKAAITNAQTAISLLQEDWKNATEARRGLFPFTAEATQRVDTPSQQAAAQAAVTNANAALQNAGTNAAVAASNADIAGRAQTTAEGRLAFDISQAGVDNRFKALTAGTNLLEALTNTDKTTLAAITEAFGEGAVYTKNLLDLFTLNDNRTHNWVSDKLKQNEMDLQGLNLYMTARANQQKEQMDIAIQTLNYAGYISGERFKLAQHTLASPALGSGGAQPYLNPGSYLSQKAAEAGIPLSSLQLAPADLAKMDPAYVLKEARGFLPEAHGDEYWGVPQAQEIRDRVRAIDVGPKPTPITPEDIALQRPFTADEINAALAKAHATGFGTIAGVTNAALAGGQDQGDTAGAGDGENVDETNPWGVKVVDVPA